MDLFTRLFGDLLVFVYHCFDRVVIHGYLSGLSRPEQVVHFFRRIVGVAALSKEVLSARTTDYQSWVEAFAAIMAFPVSGPRRACARKTMFGPWLRRMTRAERYGVYFIFKSMEQGSTFRVSMPK